MSTNHTIIHVGKLNQSPLVDLAQNYELNEILCICDQNTKQHAIQVQTLLQRMQNKCNILQINDGETNKNIETATKIWGFMTQNNISRNALIINVGGGVITDLGGFVAATYKRGVDFINIPTTLLAMIDAAIGGKTGIDFQNFKNQIGAFYHPKAVLIDTTFLQTLPQNHILSGYAEALKHGLIADANYWNYCAHTSIQNIDWESLITKSINIKSEIVKQDPSEQDYRKLLNFGHTIGHAIETHYLNQNQTLLHGLAVAAGMQCEAYIAMTLGHLSQTDFEQIQTVLNTMFPKINISEKHIPQLIHSMKQDKKNNNTSINFTLLEQIGKGIINKTTTGTIIKESINYYIHL